MPIRHTRRWTHALTIVAFMSANQADAQVCANPQILISHSDNILNTCIGDTTLTYVCGSIPLGGPAAVALLEMSYPIGWLHIQPMDSNFLPIAVLLNAQCSGDAGCIAAVFDTQPGGMLDIDLSAIDSGRYFLVIAPPLEFSWPPSCGEVSISWYVESQQEPLLGNGIFRSGITPFWAQ